MIIDGVDMAEEDGYTYNRIKLAKLVGADSAFKVNTTSPESRARNQRYRASKKKKEALEEAKYGFNNQSKKKDSKAALRKVNSNHTTIENAKKGK